MEILNGVSKRNCWTVLALAIFFFTWTLSPAHAITKNSEEQYLSVITGGSVVAKTVVAKKITQSLVKNDEIFVEIERQLICDHDSESKKNYIETESAARRLLVYGESDEGGGVVDKNHLDQIAWFCKALASSGNDKYRQTLQQIAKDAKDPKLQHYAQQSVELIPFYAKRNRILEKNSKYVDQGFDADSAKFAVMLESDVNSLKRDAAKNIFRATFVNPRLFDVVEQELLESIGGKSDGQNIDIDTLSWMCKALGSSGNGKYMKTLRLLVDESSSPKLKRYAGQAYDLCSH